MRMVENTTSPFDGLKTVLFSLFSEEDLRVSSLKGITTLAGGASTALNKEKLNNLYCKYASFSPLHKNLASLNDDNFPCYKV